MRIKGETKYTLKSPFAEDRVNCFTLLPGERAVLGTAQGLFLYDLTQDDEKTKGTGRAVVRLYRGDKILTRQVQGAGGYLAQSSKTVHFGLGDDPTVDGVEITWPGGARQRLDGVAANKLHDVVEPTEPK